MTELFKPVNIGKLELKNRVVRSATWDGAADDKGAVTDSSLELYRELARGGIGLIVSGHAFVSSHGQATPSQYGIHTDDMIPGLRKLTEAVHREGSKIAVQITHCGINSLHLRRQGLPVHVVSGKDGVKGPQQEMKDGDVEELVNDFAAAAGRAVEAGFDAVQLHGAHGYLMSQFLSPLFHSRSDNWGGILENRSRFHLEVIERVRKTVGEDYPLFIKFGVQDDEEGGLSLDEGIKTARAMVDKGLDAIEVSAGVGAGRAVPRKSEGDPEETPYRKRAAVLKKAISVPVILVAGIRHLETAEDILDSGDADLISLCRPFIRQPDLLLLWQRGEDAPATCISCNKCMPGSGLVLSCGEDRRLREEAGSVN
ncbi:MAG: NADH:flavin oxidoreductase [Dehalococcoidales bacterium]